MKLIKSKVADPDFCRYYNKIITGIRLTVNNSIVDTNSFNLDPDWDPLFWPNLIRIQGIVMEKKISFNQISSLKNRP